MTILSKETQEAILAAIHIQSLIGEEINLRELSEMVAENPSNNLICLVGQFILETFAFTDSVLRSSVQGRVFVPGRLAQ